MSEKSIVNLPEKVVIVTGASAGIGAAIALEFARQGCHLTLCGRNEERLQQVRKTCLEAGNSHIKIEYVSGDIVDADVQRKILAVTYRAFGRIDILIISAGISICGLSLVHKYDVSKGLNCEQRVMSERVNNAGLNFVRDPSNTEREVYDKIMRTNLESIFFLTQLAIPYLIKTQGSIINISSIASISPMVKSVVYTMAKAALDSYTKVLSLYLAPHKVRVNSVNPGTVESLLYKRGKETMNDERYAKFKSMQSSSDIHPLGRIGLASEIADAVVFLASDRASFITGQILFVDGGRSNVGAQPKL